MLILEPTAIVLVTYQSRTEGTCGPQQDVARPNRRHSIWLASSSHNCLFSILDAEGPPSLRSARRSGDANRVDLYRLFFQHGRHRYVFHHGWGHGSMAGGFESLPEGFSPSILSVSSAIYQMSLGAARLSAESPGVSLYCHVVHGQLSVFIASTTSGST
jgi:hypothetical protein